MKKRITVTIAVLFLFTIMVGGLLYWRNLEPVPDTRSGTEHPQAAAEQESGRSETEIMSTEQQAGSQQTETQPAAEINEPQGDTSLLFTGDVLFSNTFVNTYSRNGIAGVLSDEILNELTQADITMVNQEFPFSTRGLPMEDKQYTFRADPAYANTLTEMGVNIVSLANNHILDYGKEALMDTFTTLDENRILYAGAGETAERAKQTQIIEKNGRTFGFLSASRVIPDVSWNIDNAQPGVFATYDGTGLCEAIAEAEQVCDYVVVFVHWGVEHEQYPKGYQTSLAKQYIDSGADLVIGSHTHCLQGIEYYNGKPICYSLGNFIFGSSIERTMAVKVTVDANGDAGVQLIPAKASGGCTVKMTEQESENLYRYMEQISTGIFVDEYGNVKAR